MVKLIGDFFHTMTGLKAPPVWWVPYLNLIIDVVLGCVKSEEK